MSDDYSDGDLVDDAAYAVMEAVNEAGESWGNDEYLRHAAEYQVESLDLDDGYVDEIIEKSREWYAPDSARSGGDDVE